MIQFNAHFDGEKICPEEPVSLPQGVILRVTVDAVQLDDEPVDSDCESRPALSPAELFAHIESKIGLHEHPADWSAEHDHYLYGAPKRNDQSE